MKLYYYIMDNEKVGPYTFEELRTKNIHAETLIWYEGLPNWIRAKDDQDLNSFYSMTPPPIIENLNSPPPLPKQPENKSYHFPDNRMFKNPFNSDGRIRRSEYLLSNIIVIFYLAISFTFLDTVIFEESPTDGDGFFYFCAMIPGIWFLAAQSAKRCHDLGNSGWFQFIPFYHFTLLFTEGIRIPNKYGPSPK